ncbi:hypothetical protein ACHAXA_010089 [Cyclostephanos tholiformis]
MVPQSWRRTTPINGEDRTRWASSFIVPSVVCALMVALTIAGFFIFYRRKQRQRADGDDRKGEDDGIDDNEGGFAVNAKGYEGSVMPPIVRAKAAYDAAKMAAPALSSSPKGNVATGANDGGRWVVFTG